MKRRNYTADANTKQLRKGLKKIHIGNDVWLIGKIATVDNKKHQVIYGPDNKEYHVWDKDVEYINTITIVDSEWNKIRQGAINRHGNQSLQNKFKIYVLTHILDAKENWIFDLSKIPMIGSLKVIYSNGTVKNIEFTGKFEPFYPQKYLKSKYCRDIKYFPVAYRLTK